MFGPFSLLYCKGVMFKYVAFKIINSIVFKLGTDKSSHHLDDLSYSD